MLEIKSRMGESWRILPGDYSNWLCYREPYLPGHVEQENQVRNDGHSYLNGIYDGKP